MHGTDRLHRARQYGAADGSEPDQGRPSGRRFRRLWRGRREAQGRRRGGGRVESARMAVARADAVITMLPSGNEVREVYLGAGGALESANAGTLLIDSSTIDVDPARLGAAAAGGNGLPV